MSSPFEHCPVALIVADSAGTAASVNGAWCELVGGGPDDWLGDGWLAAVDQDDRRHLLAAIAEAADTGGTPKIDLEFVLGSGPRWTRWWLRRLPDGSRVVMAVIDISDERAWQAELAERATRDPLTGLVNRSEFLAFVDHALRRLDRDPGHVAIFFVDLDGFKAVNDRAGHLVGDRVLAAAARRLSDAVRPTDVVGRVGGDEFAVLCEDIDGADPYSVAGRVRDAFVAPLDVEGTAWVVSASVGTAVAQRPDVSPEMLLDTADRAMYATRGHHRMPEPAGAASRHNPVLRAMADRPPAGLPVEAVTDLVHHLSSVGLMVASCADSVDEPVTGRLMAATDKLEAVVGDLRRFVLDQGARRRPAP